MSARQGGGQTYLLNLLAHPPLQEGVEILLLAPQSLKMPGKIRGVRRLEPAKALDNPVLRVLWEIFWLGRTLKRQKVDLLFSPGGTSMTLLPKRCKSVTMFRNMLPFAPEERKRYPLGYMRMRLWMLRFLQEWAFNRADLVIFISDYARKVIDSALPHRRGTSVVIHHGINDHFRGKEAMPRPSQAPEKFVLYVSILDVYKAQVEVVESWAMAKKQVQNGTKLVFIGPEFPSYGKKVRETIERLGLDKEVIVMGNVPYHELPAYYHHALINIFASSCENCPNILLEALAAGRPVLASDRDPMPEFAQESAEYFDPYQPKSLAVLLSRYLQDADLRDRRGQAARVHSENFQWRDTAARTWDALIALGEN